MKLHHYRAPHGNFGDDLNGWLWESLVPGAWDEDPETLFVGIGTLLGRDLPPARKRIVFGTGAGYGRPPQSPLDLSWEIVCVRGPLTARALGLPGKCAVTDGALLLASFPEYDPQPEDQRSGIAFMPHHGHMTHPGWSEACRRAGIELLDPRADSRSTVARIRGCRRVLAEAMHAAVVADALRVPWVPVISSQRINMFKWLDWTASMELPYRPRRVPPIAPWEAVGEKMRTWLGGSRWEERLDPDRAMEALCSPPRDLRGALLRTAGRLGGWGLLKACVPSAEERRCEAVSLALREAALGPAFLSGETCHRTRREELLRRLDGLRQRLPKAGRSSA